MYGAMCQPTHTKCADEGLDNKDGKPLCKEREGDHYELAARLSVPMTVSGTLGVEWHPVLSSGFSDVLSVPNLCDISVHITEGLSNTISLSVNVARKELDEANGDLTHLSTAVTDGSLLRTLKRRGVQVDDARSIVMQTAKVAGIVAVQYNCQTKEVWTEEKTRWCCDHQNLGCEN
jgi:hypothetical protein